MKLILPVLFLPLLCFAATVVETFDAPDTGITALAWGDGVLWALDGTTQYMYQINPSDGSVLSSFYVMDQTPSYDPVPGGLTYAGGTLFACMHDSTVYVSMYELDTSGNHQDDWSINC